MSSLASNGDSSNAYNFHLFVSTNYINPHGFVSGLGNPTNVNYFYANDGNVLDWEQNIANLYFLPRPPVFVPTNPSIPGYDFRYYLDLNENGAFDPNGWQPVTALDPPAGLWYFDTNGNRLAAANLEPPNVLSNFFVGDPEWVGVLGASRRSARAEQSFHLPLRLHRRARRQCAGHQLHSQPGAVPE